MITEWQKVKLEFFLESIFPRFWNGEGKTPEQVLEVQNYGALEEGDDEFRTFFGRGCNPADYRALNEHYFKLVGLLKEVANGDMEAVNESLAKTKIFFCSFEGGPRMIPFGDSPTHYALILQNCFGIKQEGIKQTDHPFVLVKDGYVRIRTYDLQDWKNMVHEYIQGGFIVPDHYKEGDEKA